MLSDSLIISLQNGVWKCVLIQMLNFSSKKEEKISVR